MNHLLILTLEFRRAWGGTDKASRACTVDVTTAEPIEHWFQWAFDDIQAREGFDPHAGFAILHWSITPCGTGNVDLA